MKAQNRVLAIAVHPDDETLGCGGTLLKHKAAGDEIHWLIVTAPKEEDGFTKKEIAYQDKIVAEVAKAYSFNGVHHLDIPTTKVDMLPMAQIVQKLDKLIKKVKPEIIYLPFKADVHSDHRKFFDAAFSCIKSFRNPFIKKVLMMEVISETELAPSLQENAFLPNYFVDISQYLDQKLKIMALFDKEIGQHPFPRSLKNIEAQATYRGAMILVEAAESFMLLKEIA